MDTQSSRRCLSLLARVLVLAAAVALLAGCVPPPEEPLDTSQLCPWWNWMKVGFYAAGVLIGAGAIGVAGAIRMGAPVLPQSWLAKGDMAIAGVLTGGFILIAGLAAFWWAAGYLLGESFNCSEAFGGAAGVLRLLLLGV